MNVICCSLTPTAIIKATLLGLLHNDIPCIQGEETSLGLFGLTGTYSADTASLPDLIEELAARGVPAAWLQKDQGAHLRRLIAGSLRYSAPDRSSLAFAATEEAVRHGPDYCLNGIGQVSRQLLTRYRVVGHEVHKMTGFVRFHPAGEGVLAARPRLFHDTADLLLRQFTPRYPAYRLVLILPDHALAWEAGRFFPVDPASYATYVDSDPFTATWEEYYRSQYIATRKNIALAKRLLPRKYWEYLSEGSILADEAAK